MPSMSETITALRNAIYKKVTESCKLPDMFAEEIKDSSGFAFRPGFSYRAAGANNDGKPWESLLFQAGQLKVILQYGLDRKHAGFESQRITIHGHEFSCIKLFIYDLDPLPANAGNVTRADIENILHGQLPKKQNPSYGIVNAQNTQWGKHELGHVCDLRICSSGEMWNIPDGPHPGSASKLIDAAASAAADLLIPAEYYSRHREELFA